MSFLSDQSASALAAAFLAAIQSIQHTDQTLDLDFRISLSHCVNAAHSMPANKTSTTGNHYFDSPGERFHNNCSFSIFICAHYLFSWVKQKRKLWLDKQSVTFCSIHCAFFCNFTPVKTAVGSLRHFPGNIRG